MNVNVRRFAAAALFAAGFSAVLPGTAAAQMVKSGNDYLSALSVVSEKLQPGASLESIDGVQGILASGVGSAWAGFQNLHGDWTAYIDSRSGLIESAEGSGIPWVPGRGNQLTRGDIAAELAGRSTVDLATLEAVARRFVKENSSLLGVEASSLRLNQGRSGQPADHVWFVDFDVTRAGLPIDGARVVFRVNHGNLIQFGMENLPPAGVAVPELKVKKDAAFQVVAAHVGGINVPTDTILDAGSYRLIPTNARDEKFAQGFAFGKGYALTGVWEVKFRRDGIQGTWRARVDAATGELIEFRDVNDYARATGGTVITPGTETVRAMPFTNVSTGGFTNSAGVYNFTGAATTSSLAGQYVRAIDTCGAISLSATPGTGDLTFGTSAGSNCTTPGFGGAGNTRSSRTQFYWLNRIKEVGRGWLPANAWLSAQLTANVNLNQTCNAYWNGSTVNFFRSGGGCGNTGELPGVSLHEYGHGLDSNDGNGSSPENGTGETIGDFTAALALHESCIGPGFLASNCGGYGDACTSCTGVRDIDWAKRVSGVPHTVSNFTQVRCPTSAIGYVGPCNREGHCESYISSEALWDLANRDLPSPGSGAAWTVVDRLWYLSRSTGTRAFTCTATGTWTSNGCNVGSLWKVFRAVDDDNGNLNDGTPHSGAMFAAFNRHGIACTTDPGASTTFAGCTPPATPTLTLTPGSDSASASWSNSGAGIVYDVFRNESGCNAGFTKVANDVATTSFADSGVGNGTTYFYQVVAHPSGNEACGGAPTTCTSVTPAAAPCTPPAAPTGVSAIGTGTTTATVSWTASAGATGYNILRSTTSGGPYTQVGTSTTTSFADTGLTCNTTYYYVVQATNAPTCASGNSAQASATTSVCPACTTTTLYTNTFETGTGLSNWTRGSFGGSGTVTPWRGIQTCTAQGGTKIFRYGGTSCTADYTSNNFNFGQPNGAAGISVPAGSTTSRLSFGHRRAFESGFDGATLAVSVDGTNYTFVPASAILTNGYNGTIAASCAPTGTAGASVWTGNATTFTTTTVDLDAACNAASGTTTGCAGRAVRIAFTTISDCSVTGDGWFLDNVTVQACTP